LRDTDRSKGVVLKENVEDGPASPSIDYEMHFGDDPDAQATLHTLMPPELPTSLTPGQAAQLAEMFQFFHLRFRGLLRSVKTDKKSPQVTLEQRQWQNLLDLQDRLACYLRAIGEPGE